MFIPSQEGRSHSARWGVGLWGLIFYQCLTLSTPTCGLCGSNILSTFRTSSHAQHTMKRPQRALCEGRILTLVWRGKRWEDQVVKRLHPTSSVCAQPPCQQQSHLWNISLCLLLVLIELYWVNSSFICESVYTSKWASGWYYRFIFPNELKAKGAYI